MFILKKLITPFLLPPGIFVLVLAVLGVAAGFRKNRRLCTVYTSLAIGLWVLSSAPAAHWLTRSLESGYSMSSIPETDIIIMLGGGVYSRSPDMSGIGAPSQGTLERLVTAARLHRRTGAPILLSGGQVFDGAGSSALIAARFLQDLGIPAQFLIVEDQSRDTYENALYSSRICRRKGFEKPVVVTSAIHMRRSLLCFKAVGLDVAPFPCGFRTWPGQKLHWSACLPSYEQLDAAASALHEWLGLLYYRMKY
jgi:uncharacterized SAM-binding protein YcdF (DUF218 family)